MSATMLKPAPEPTATAPARRAPFAWAAGVFAVACAVFGVGLGDEPHFVDESAYVAQSYFADLFLEGRRDDPAWLEYPGLDLPPLAKYVVGLSWRVAGFPRPGPMAAAAWYEDTSRRFETPASLVAARVPMVVLGALGCVAIYAIGSLAFGLASGLVAAGLLMVSPLYYLHARRAMSDTPAEACGLVALAIGLAAWLRVSLAGSGGMAAFVGRRWNGTVRAGVHSPGWPKCARQAQWLDRRRWSSSRGSALTRASSSGGA